jgi:hypothetical protein
MSEQFKNPNNLGILSVSSTSVEKDSKGRDRTVLKLDTPKGGPAAGTCQVTELINLISPFKGKAVKLDVRVGERESSQGRTFKTAFIMVNKMSDDSVQYVDKGSEAHAQVSEG